MSNYAKLGYGCITSMDMLLSNTKFLPLTSPIYTLKNDSLQRNNLNKTRFYEKTQAEQPKKISNSCCGR